LGAFSTQLTLASGGLVVLPHCFSMDAVLSMFFTAGRGLQRPLKPAGPPRAYALLARGSGPPPLGAEAGSGASGEVRHTTSSPSFWLDRKLWRKMGTSQGDKMQEGRHKIAG
jgi:hypothetical protein